MNRALIACLVAAALTSACGPRVRSTDVVARVGDQRLTAAHLEALVKAMPPVSRPAVAVPAIVRAWMDLTLAADALAGGVDLADSAFMADLMAPRQAAEVLVRLRAALAARRPGLPAGEADRLYASDSVRILQQILVPVGDWHDSSVVTASRRVADSVLALGSKGQPFTALAKRYSAAIGPYGGQISVVWKRTVPEQARAQIWALRPGGTMAGKIPVGFVIVHRPLLGDVRAELTADLLAAVNAHADSVFADSVSKARGLRVAADGVSRLRIALGAGGVAKDTEPLATFQGGALSPRRALVWLAAIQDQVPGGLDTQSDSGLAGALLWAGRNELLTVVARDFGVNVTWQDLASARAGLLSGLAPLQSQFRGLATEPARAQKVDSLLVAVGRGESVPIVPGVLSRVLRRRATLAINEAPLSALIQRLSLAEPPQPAPSTGAPFGQ
jgi:hypothetical protein